MVEVGNNHAVLHRVAAHNAAGRHAQIEDRIACRRKLVHKFFGRCSAIVGAFVRLFQNHHAAALDALVIGADRSGYKIGKGNAGDKTAALIHLQPGLLAVLPLGHAQLAVQHAGVHAHIRHGLGEREGSAPRLAVFSRLRGCRQLFVVRYLLGSSALVNRRKSQKSRQAPGGRAAIHPGQLKGSQAERQILWPNDKAAFFRLHKGSRNAGGVELVHHGGFGGRPLMRVALARCHQPRHGAARHTARRLHQHLQVKTVGKAPLNLPHCIARQGKHFFDFGYGDGAHGAAPLISAHSP